MTQNLTIFAVLCWALVGRSGSPCGQTLFDFDWRFVKSDPAGAQQADRRRAYHGRALIVVRTRRESGKIALQATAEGLEPTVLSLEVQ